MKIVAYA